MKATHKLSFSGRCPVDDAIDHYIVTIETHRIIKVEDIISAIKALPQPAYQEDHTSRLAFTLQCRVTTIGYHSGVETTCVAG